jgi:hypothetical protein
LFVPDVYADQQAFLIIPGETAIKIIKAYGTKNFANECRKKEGLKELIEKIKTLKIRIKPVNYRLYPTTACALG